MRAIRFQGETPAIDPRATEPSPVPGEAVVRTIRAMIPARCVSCHFVPGREFIGVVERLHQGAGADERRLVGRRVVGSPEVPCAACVLCRSGLAAHCRERRVLGERGLDGCLAERFVIPARNLIPVPDSLGDDAAVFALAAAEAMHAAQAAGAEGGGFVTVLGDGAAALLCVQAAARRNPATRLIGWRPERFGLAEKWGVRHRPASETGRRQDQAVVIDCTGTAESFALAARLVRPRGTVVLAAPPPNAGYDLSAAVESELVITGVRGGQLREGVGALERGEIEVMSLVARRVRLEQAPAAFAAAQDGLRTLVEFG